MANLLLLPSSATHRAKRLRCAALATGMKCLPQNRIALCHGNVLHDSHAEVLAIRAFNRYLVEECADLAAREKNSLPGGNHFAVVEQTQTGNPHASSGASKIYGSEPSMLWDAVRSQAHGASRTKEDGDRSDAWLHRPFRIRDDIKIHMYCSEAPCGDASMELTMAAQDDATPWSLPPTGDVAPLSTDHNHFVAKPGGHSPAPPAQPVPSTQDLLHGRGYFGALGVVRGKPSRPDAPPSLSKSCSDKLALKQCTSLLSSVASILIEPGTAYLETLVLPKSQHVPTACERAFGPAGRMAAMIREPCQRSSEYSFRPFRIRSTSREFALSRRFVTGSATTAVTPSNLATISFGSTQETQINGVLRGRKQYDPSGASTVSRRRLWVAAFNLALSCGAPAAIQALEKSSYAAMKSSSIFDTRKRVKEEARRASLRGWQTNVGDDGWSL